MNFLKKICNLKNIDWVQIKENLYYLSEIDLRTREQDLIYEIKDETIEECAREIDEYRNNLKELCVLDSQQTIEILTKHPKSFTRYGDGEIHVMEGLDQDFQQFDPVLARRLQEILENPREDVYVGLNHAYWESPSNYAERNKKFYRIRATRYRRFFVDHCYMNKTYLDAACFGAYYRYDENFDYEGHYKRIKNLFAGKKIAIIAGTGVFEKLSFNVFDKSETQMIVHGPQKNAFSQYELLINKIEKTVPKDYLVCLILGQTATVMVPDLTDLGYMAWDVGHLAKDYDAYMKKTEKTQKNMDAFWAPD